MAPASSISQTSEERATVIIVFWDGLNDLRHCLNCLRAQTQPPAEIIIVDNSPDHKCSGFDDVSARIRLITPQDNVGFARGNNLAIAECKTELVVTLNADAFAQPQWLENLVRAAREFPDAAAFGSLQVMHEDRTRLDGSGDCYHVSGLMWRTGEGDVFKNKELSARAIFSPCGAAALYRKSVFEEVGGFDEDFFCYCEDVDLGFRLWLAGWRCCLVPDAIVHHRGGGSSGGKMSEFGVYHGHRNTVWVFVKNMPGFLFWALLPVHFLLNVEALIVLAVRDHGRVACKAKIDAIKGLPAAWRKRCAVQRARCIGPREIWRILDKSFPPTPWRGRRRLFMFWRKAKKPNSTPPSGSGVSAGP